MRTPGNDHELALGFLCSESIISSHKDIDSIASIGETQNKDGLQNIVRVTLNQSVDFDPSDRRGIFTPHPVAAYVEKHPQKLFEQRALKSIINFQ